MRRSSMFFSSAEVQSLESRVLLSSPETALSIQLLEDSQATSISLQHDDTNVQTAAAVKGAAAKVDLVKTEVPIWTFERFKATGLYEKAWTNVKGKGQSPREISWMGDKIGFIFNVKSTVKWSPTVTFNFYVANNYTRGARVQIWAGPNGSDKPVGKIIKIMHNGNYSVKIKSSVFKLGANKITIVGTNVDVGYGEHSPTFILSYVDLTRTALVVKPPEITGYSLSLASDSQIFNRNETISATGNIFGKGNGVLKYDWWVSGPNDIFEKVGDTLTTTMENGFAPVPSFSGFLTHEIGSYSSWIEVTSPQVDYYESPDGFEYEIIEKPIVTPTTPSIAITSVPIPGTSVYTYGKVTGFNYADYDGVAVYLCTQGRWWNKSGFSWPLTGVANDGTWSTVTLVGGDDDLWTEIRAYIVPKGFEIPLTNDLLPDSLSGLTYVSAQRV